MIRRHFDQCRAWNDAARLFIIWYVLAGTRAKHFDDKTIRSTTMLMGRGCVCDDDVGCRMEAFDPVLGSCFACVQVDKEEVD